MNYKFYALILTLTLAATPAMQAMRATRGLVATARSLRPAIQAGKQALAQTHAPNSNGHGYGQEEPRHARDNYYIPAATAIAVGLGLNAQHALEQKEDYTSVDKLDINNIDAVINVFKNGTEEEQQEVAKKVAQKIRTYRFEDIIEMLQNIGENQPRILLIEALSNNITYYSVAQIKEILIASNYCIYPNSHEIMAHALKKNYHYFTHNKFLGYSYSKKDGLSEYLKVIEGLNWQYLHIAFEPLIADVYEAISKQIIDSSNTPAAKTNITIPYEIARKISQCHYSYTDQQLCTLLKISDDDTQEIICRGIVHDIRRSVCGMNGQRLYQILLSVCEKNRASVANEWGYRLEHAENMAKFTGEKAKDNFIETLKDHELYELLISSNGDSQNYFLKKFLKNYDFKNGRYITDFIRGNIQKMQDLIYASISNEWGLTESDWAEIHHSFNKHIHSIAHASNSDKQFTYACNVSDSTKHLITLICKKRNITEELIVKEIEDKENFAAIETSLTNTNHVKQSLQINTSHPRADDYETMHFCFEHELGGHLRHHHGLLRCIILITIYHKHHIKFKNFKEGTSESPALDDIRNSASFQALAKAHEYEADLSSAIDDIAYASEVKNYAKNEKEGNRPSLYMSQKQLYRIISAIIKLKEAEQKWFDGEEAYNLYGPPAYDRMVFNESEISVEQNEKD